MFQERLEGEETGSEGGGGGGGDEQSARGLMLAIEVSRFGSNWQPLKRFRGRAGAEAA